MKQCSKCKVTKPKSEFNRDRSSSDGLQYKCKECQKQWLKVNSYKHAKYNKQYREANREKVLERNKQYYKANREKLLERRKQYYKSARETNPENYLYTAAKRRAKERGLEFNIEVSDIVIPESCPVLGLKLEIGEGRQQDNSPTLDRIDSSKGYIKGNIEVISWRANSLKKDATPEELQKLATYYKRNSL